MLALLLAAPTLALLPRHCTLRSVGVAPRAPPLIAQESRLRQALPKRDDLDREIMLTRVSPALLRIMMRYAWTRR